MGAVLALSAEQWIAACPEAVFALFGAGSGAGWLFDAACDRVAPGVVITLRAPLGGPTGPVDLLGRIAEVRPPSRIDVRVDQPWRGRLRLGLRPDGGGTRARLVVDLDAAGLDWLMRRRGHNVTDDPPAGEHPVGLLTSKSGAGSVFAAATENLAVLAATEINADGGIRGKPLRLVVGDDGTDPALGAVEAWRLVGSGCRTILACTTSATFARLAAEFAGTDVLLVHALMNEGGLGGALRVQLGERPIDQMAAAAGSLLGGGGTHWFLAGNDYVWPRRVHAAAREVLAERGGIVAGEAFAPLGTRDFTPIVERVVASGADVVLSSFVGADLVGFERQCHAMGVRERCRSLALALDEPTRERIGDAAAVGMWGVSGYFEQLPDEANHEFLRRYRAAFGAWVPPVSSISEATYEAVHLYASAARRAREGDPRGIARELRRSRSRFPRGEVEVDGPETVRQQLYLAEATPTGLTVTRPVAGTSRTRQRASAH